MPCRTCLRVCGQCRVLLQDACFQATSLAFQADEWEEMAMKAEHQFCHKTSINRKQYVHAKNVCLEYRYAMLWGKLEEQFERKLATLKDFRAESKLDFDFTVGSNSNLPHLTVSLDRFYLGRR